MPRTRTIRRAPKKTRKAKTKQSHSIPFIPDSLQAFFARRFVDIFAGILALSGLFIIAALATYSQQDPSWNTASALQDSQTIQNINNWMGHKGALLADIFIQTLGGAGFALGGIALIWAARIFARQGISIFPLRVIALLFATVITGVALAQIPSNNWNPQGFLGGAFGTLIVQTIGNFTQGISPLLGYKTVALLAALIAIPALLFAADTRKIELAKIGQFIGFVIFSILSFIAKTYISIRNWIGHYNDENYVPKPVTMFKGVFENPIQLPSKPPKQTVKAAPKPEPQISNTQPTHAEQKLQPSAPEKPASIPVVTPEKGKAIAKSTSDNQQTFSLAEGEEWEFPPIDLLEEVPDNASVPHLNEAALRKNAELLQNVLADFNIEGDITSIHPGPVVTLYELEPAPGTKSSKVISLADDIARSMSAVMTASLTSSPLS